MTAFGPRLAKVVNQQVGGFIAERQLYRLLGFGLGHPQRTTTPVEVIEGQAYQLPTAQAVSCGQIQQGEIAKFRKARNDRWNQAMPATGATEALAATALSDTPAGYRAADARFEKASPERAAAAGMPEQSPRYAAG